MSAQRDAQWEAYYSARAKAMRAQAEAHRLYGEAERLSPIRANSGDYYERLAARYDHDAAKLESGVEA